MDKELKTTETLSTQYTNTFHELMDGKVTLGYATSQDTREAAALEAQKEELKKTLDAMLATHSAATNEVVYIRVCVCVCHDAKIR